MKEVLIKRVYDVPFQTLADDFVMNDDFRSEYHSALGHSDIMIQSWGANGTRNVSFKTPFDAPDVVKSMLRLGKSATTAVLQKQKVEKSASEINIHIDTILSGVPLAESFCMTATMSCKAVDVKSELSLVCRCTFTGKLPGAKGKIESQMESDSKISWGKYFEMISEKIPSSNKPESSSLVRPTNENEETASSSRNRSQTDLSGVKKEHHVAESSTGNSYASLKEAPAQSKSAQDFADAGYVTRQQENDPRRHSSFVPPSIGKFDTTFKDSKKDLYSDAIVDSFKYALEESEKEKSLLIARAKELEERVYATHMKYQTLFNVVKSLSEQDFLQELSVAMLQLGSTEEQVAFAEQRYSNASKQRNMLEFEYQEMKSDYPQRYENLMRKIQAYENENLAISKTIETLVATGATTSKRDANAAHAEKSTKSGRRGFFKFRKSKKSDQEQRHNQDDTASVHDGSVHFSEYPVCASETHSEANYGKRHSVVEKK